MYSLFERTTIEIATFLSMVLPELSVDWWQKFVLASLNPYQKDKLSSSGNSTLESLDLAALLRILNDNWYQISSNRGLCTDDRHYLKEMSSVRNRWAHPSGLGICRDDQYRDLDTLQRFLQMIDAKTDVIHEVKQKKLNILSERHASSEYEVDASENDQTSLTVGQIVRHKSNPDWKGAIVSIQISGLENRINVFGQDGLKSFYESQLELIHMNDEVTLISVDEFHAALTALQIRHPNLSTLYSLNAARIDFIPYQFRPVLKFIRSERPRLLIADSVGVGKTIEAGLILRELQARRDIQSVLIICPRPLVVEKKWLNEMRRFDERFTQLTSSDLRLCMDEYNKDGVWLERHRKTIIPYSLFDESLLYGEKKKGKKKLGLLDLDPPPRFDMVIVDEAHHIRNTKTFGYKAVNFFCENAEAVLFLTATPIQLGSNDLFVLLNTLRPDLIIDHASFEHMSEPNPHINAAAKAVRYAEQDWNVAAKNALIEAGNTSWGTSILKANPMYNSILNELSSNHIEHENRVKIISDIENLHTFNSMINRTRRRDIGRFITRTPETIRIEFTPEQSLIHDELLNVQKQILSSIHGSTSINFMMSTIRRQAASSIYGLVPFLEDILSRHLDELDWDDIDGEQPDESAIQGIHEQIKLIIEISKSLSGDDPKLSALQKIIIDKQPLSNNKLMLFSSFKHTLNYLYKKLSADSTRVGLIHGGVKDEDRVELRRRFELDKQETDCIDVLLFSEVGCEGLDYQFCDAMVNYDLPWNPMRIEQRIGRIDRNGQKSPKVIIYNMITPDTIDSDIYERCLLRIGIFNRSLGDSEDILGEITNEIKNIAENLNLTPEERKANLQQLADNKIRKIQEEQKLEQQQHELFGIEIPSTQMKDDIESASSFWLTPKMLEHLISQYLKAILGIDQDYVLGDKEAKTLRLSQEARTSLLTDYQSLSFPKSSISKEWELWLKGGSAHLSITFDSVYAMNNTKTVFINPIHPLVKQAAHHLSKPDKAYSILRVTNNELPSGIFDFAIYQWQMHGIKNDLLIKPVCSSDIIGKDLLKLIECSEDVGVLIDTIISPERWDCLDSEHYKLWNEAKDEHKARIKELVEYRKESLITTHKARIAYIQDQISKVSEEKILRMHKASMTNAEADYARRLQELEIAVEKADITASVVMYGIIIIKENRYGN